MRLGRRRGLAENSEGGGGANGGGFGDFLRGRGRGLRVDAGCFGDTLHGGDDVVGFVWAVVVVEQHGGVVLRGEAFPGEPGAGGREVGGVAVACQGGKACWAGGRC